jgi:hypothetical protein
VKGQENNYVIPGDFAFIDCPLLKFDVFILSAAAVGSFSDNSAQRVIGL